MGQTITKEQSDRSVKARENHEKCNGERCNKNFFIFSVIRYCQNCVLKLKPYCSTCVIKRQYVEDQPYLCSKCYTKIIERRERIIEERIRGSIYGKSRPLSFQIIEDKINKNQLKYDEAMSLIKELIELSTPMDLKSDTKISIKWHQLFDNILTKYIVFINQNDIVDYVEDIYYIINSIRNDLFKEVQGHRANKYMIAHLHVLNLLIDNGLKEIEDV